MVQQATTQLDQGRANRFGPAAFLHDLQPDPASTPILHQCWRRAEYHVHKQLVKVVANVNVLYAFVWRSASKVSDKLCRVLQTDAAEAVMAQGNFKPLT